MMTETPPQRLRRLAMAQLPKLLTLQDRNPHSDTYGCFDRDYWHLRIKDFPSGMAQEFVLPLALAYSTDFEGNAFFRAPSLRDWVRAGVAYAAQSAHADGSCDDYYPFEKAAGAAAFSLYASLEALPRCDIALGEFEPFLRRRAQWLGGHEESGRLSNHEALIANCLFRLAAATADDTLEALAKRRLERLMSWRDAEGWFYEYQGCDPGYLTLTIANLAEIDRARPELGLRPPIADAVRFLLDLTPPDGWVSGEWTSRNTNNYFPHGFEICGDWLPDALALNDKAVAALADPPEYGDDNIVAHHCWSYLLAAEQWRADRPSAPAVGGDGRRHYPAAGLIKETRGAVCLLAALNKGGVFRVYRDDRLAHSDTGPSVRCRHRGKVRTAVSHIWSEDNEIQIGDDEITIAGQMSFAKASRMTTLKSIILRLAMLSAGRFFPDLIRRILQRLLIVGKDEAPFRFRRTFRVRADGVEVVDEISGDGEVLSVGFGAAQTSIYTVMSRVFHRPQLQPWRDETEAYRRAAPAPFTLTRRIGGAP